MKNWRENKNSCCLSFNFCTLNIWAGNRSSGNELQGAVRALQRFPHFITRRCLPPRWHPIRLFVHITESSQKRLHIPSSPELFSRDPNISQMTVSTLNQRHRELWWSVFCGFKINLLIPDSYRAANQNTVTCCAQKKLTNLLLYVKW